MWFSCLRTIIFGMYSESQIWVTEAMNRAFFSDGCQPFVRSRRRRGPRTRGLQGLNMEAVSLTPVSAASKAVWVFWTFLGTRRAPVASFISSIQPYTIPTSGLESSTDTWVGEAIGVHSSSSSRKAMYSPRAWVTPVLRAAAAPRLVSCLTARIRGSENSRTISGVLSRGAVVNYDDFVVVVGLRQDAVDGAGEEVGAVGR